MAEKQQGREAASGFRATIKGFPLQSKSRGPMIRESEKTKTKGEKERKRDGRGRERDRERERERERERWEGYVNSRGSEKEREAGGRAKREGP